MSRMRICLRFLSRRGTSARAILFLVIAMGLERLPAESAWIAVGPSGGDARAFAAVPGDPRHLYLGTTDSWIYESLDAGTTWRRLTKLDGTDDLVVDNIVVDGANSSTIYAAAWKVDETGGGSWVSHDGGKSWSAVEGLSGQSVRAFAQAPSNPGTLFAGTMEGVFRSTDAGASWNLISPRGSREIHEVESLAVDPADPRIVYAGTWHLPWKTVDGGKKWESIKKGVIEDSDVFSIIVDPVKPRTVFLSACSGIYKSENSGELFHKIQGIPSDARRTRVLMQDPNHREVVYAGTTQGLYKTTDAGRHFDSMTGADVIENDVFVDPGDSSHVLLATDRGGVLASHDGGATFTASNEGFSGRKVDALLVDHADPARLYAGVVNDKSYGGAFVSSNGGASWGQIGTGLEGRDVFALAQAPDGTVFAGTSHGIFALVQDAASNDPSAGIAPHWEPHNTIANTQVKIATENHSGKRINVEKRVKAPVIEMSSRAVALDLSGDAWLASTTGGLFTSKDQGATWQGGMVMDSGDYLSVTSLGATMAAARSGGVVLSTDAGASWWPMQIPSMLTRIHRVVFSADGTLWLGAREGVYFTPDKGKKWLWIERLPFRDVDDLAYDTLAKRVLVSSRSSDQIYSIDPKTMTWKLWQTGYRIGLVRIAGDRLVAASLYDGVLVEPAAGRIETGQK
ncbi:MAG: transcriptional regulator [Terracidiphilus sp.]|nr:transcriptional regulator [Terracidiphilus sp.]